MDLYHIVLFTHILTLIVAMWATAVVKFSISRRGRARTVGEVLDWHNTITSASVAFPICLAMFVITGSYMLSVNRVNVMSTGFVVAGLVGVVLLFAAGTFLGIKGKGLKQMLEQMAKNGADRPAPALVPPAFIAALPTINTGIALSVAFDMVTKPTSIPVALSVLAVGVVLGIVTAPRHAAPAVERATAA